MFKINFQIQNLQHVF